MKLLSVVYVVLFSSIFVHPSALAEEIALEQSYRFLDPLPQSGKALPGSGIFDSGKVNGEAEVVPLESGEAQRERVKIRNLLRLVDGDSVAINERIHVQLLGVQFADYSAEDHARYTQIIKRVRAWIDEFMENPELALKNYEGMNSQINYNSGKGTDLSFFYLYVPDFILEEIRRKGLAEYDDWLKMKNGQTANTSPAPVKQSLTIPSVMEPGDTFKSRLLKGDSGERPGEVKEYIISEAKYYYDDGALKKEEIYKDGKLAIVRHFDRRGSLQKEEVFDAAMRPLQAK